MALIMTPLMILSEGIYAGIISTIGTLTLGTCRIITNVYNHKNPDANQFVESLDLEYKLQIIQHFLNYFNNKKNHDVRIQLNDLQKTQIMDSIPEAETEIIPDPIDLCLIHIQTSIQKINNCLLMIETKIKNHRQKWFADWRTLNIKPQLDTLMRLTHNLDARFEMFLKIATLIYQKDVLPLTSSPVNRNIMQIDNK